MRLVLVVASLLFLAACGRAEQGDSGIRGKAVVGTCAVVQVGMHCTRPVQTTFEVRREGQVLRSVATDAGGLFAVNLEPGSYTLVREDGLPSLRPVAVVVRPGAFTTVRLSFDSGIR